MKRSIVIERHVYAPELNRVHYVNSATGANVASVPAPGVTSVKEWRSLISKSSGPRHFVRIAARYPAQWASLDRVVSGCVSSYQAARLAIAEMRRRTAGGPLLSGETLPAAAITVSITFIG